MFPTVIYDNFFVNPDKIVEFANNQDYFPTSDGAWPGCRTEQISVLAPELYADIGSRINSIFFPTCVDNYAIEMRFQKISPFHENQYDRKNRGWIHRDRNVYYGGIIYLNKNPEPNTGTNLYQEKKGYSVANPHNEMVKRKLYLNEEINTEEYNNSFDDHFNQYKATVKVESVYNRLFMFNSKEFHGVETFGKEQERLTISFFCHGIFGATPWGAIVPPFAR